MALHPGAQRLNKRYGSFGWCIKPIAESERPDPTRYAIYGCDDNGVPRFLSGWTCTAPTPAEAVERLLSQAAA